MSSAKSSNNGDDIFVDDDDGDDDGEEPYYPPADRFLTAQVWWMASELVRRHPHLLISGVEVDEGSRLVIVHDQQDGMSIQWDLVGGCKYLVAGEVRSISWIEMMAAANAHAIVTRIEVDSGLGIPKTSPASTPHSLAYRVIANALAAAVNDRHDWYAVPAPMVHGEDVDDPACPHFEKFPTTIEARQGYVDHAIEQLDAGRGVYFFQPFWAIMRDLEPVAIMDSAGTMHNIMGATPLMPLYELCSRNLTITTARLLGPYLP